MKDIFPVAGLLLLGFAALGMPVAPAEEPSPPVTIENYYKLVPGGTKEWQELYRKNHYPILEQLKKEGILKSLRLYERRFHAMSPPWDYKVVLVFRDWAALRESRLREPEIARSLYPNREEHERQEKRRWELTVEHWDDVLSEVVLEKGR